MARYRSKLPQIFTPISSIGYSGMKILGFFSTILRVALLLLVLLAYGCTRTYVRQTTANAWNSSPATKLRAGMTSAEVSSLLEISLLEKRGWPYINVDPDVWKVEIDSYPLGIFPSGASDARLQSLFLNTLSVYRLPAIANVWAAGLVSWRIDELARQSASKDTVEVWKRAIRLRSFNRPIEVVGSTSVNAHLST